MIRIILIVVLFIGCAQKPIEKKQPIIQKAIEEVEKKAPVKPQPNYLSNIQEQVVQLINEDKYASLCGLNKVNKEQLLHYGNLKQRIILEETLLQYVHNLANSCIDLKLFKSYLQSDIAKANKSHYYYEEQDVNERKIIEQLRSNNFTIEEIIAEYIPTHPDFFKLITYLDDSTLNNEQKQKLRLSIERMKLLDDKENENFIQLNIPTYTLSMYEEGKISFSFGTVVGGVEDQTPVLSSKLNYFIVNPTWNIPDSIAKNTIIPRMLKDPNYLRKKHIQIHKNYDLESIEYNQQDINWYKYLKKNVRYIPYKFIQLPYKSNGLGRVKFMFKNDHAVYMHDTIGTWRFKIPKQSIRAVSHGCVRLEHPLFLTKHLSTHYTKYTYKDVRASYDSHKMRSVNLNKPLSVHLTYFTASIDKDDKLNFSKDLYGYDKVMNLKFK